MSALTRLPTVTPDTDPATEEDGPTPAERLELRHNLIQTRVVGAARGRSTGVYLCGRAGTGKSHTVKETLDRLGLPYAWVNSRLTAKALIYRLGEVADGGVLVVDDVPSLLDDKQAQQVLLAALGGKPGQTRPVVWETAKDRIRIPFSGSVIIISNEKIGATPIGKAIASRVRAIAHEPADEELVAFALDVIAKRKKDRETIEYAAECAVESGASFDLRTAVNSIEDREQCEAGESLLDWRTLVRTSLDQAGVAAPVAVESREERLERERELVAEADELYGDDWQSACEHTGLSKSAYYRRRAEVRAEAERASKAK